MLGTIADVRQGDPVSNEDGKREPAARWVPPRRPPARNLFSRLHRDQRGDIVDPLPIAALIIIPLVLLLIFFGDWIQAWLERAFHLVRGALGF